MLMMVLSPASPGLERAANLAQHAKYVKQTLSLLEILSNRSILALGRNRSGLSRNGGSMPDEKLEETNSAETLGRYLKSVRLGSKMTLRDVEEATGKEV